MSDTWIWHPQDHAWTKDSHVARFMAKHGEATINALRARAAADTEWFWNAAMEDMALDWFERYDRVRDIGAGFPWTKWFLGGRINVTHNAIDRHVAEGHGDEVALISEGDGDTDAERRRLTFSELKVQVDRCASALRKTGVGPGDCIGLYAPMRIEMVVAFFATMKIGARIVPVFCGFGEEALRERLAASESKFLFAAKTLRRRGKAIDTGSIALAAAKNCPTVARTLFIDDAEWSDFLADGLSPTEGERTAAEEPCLIIYTSGTTGRPKGTVHTHAGCLAQMGKELRYGFDVRPGEPFFWMTDIGWMMGPWELIGALMYRTPVVLFDGAPDYPTPDRLWQIIERHRIVTLGISPTAIRLLMRCSDGKGPEGYDLSSLRVLGSTGEPWDETSYRWFFERVGGKRCPVINISGGTEIVGCHLMPFPVEPLKLCTLGGAGLGMDVDVWDDDGNPVRGSVGHLVCKSPAPSMTKSFLGDDERYIETYFSRFPDVWYHGDWASIDADGCWYLHGRSDDTIKVAGKRVGPAEVESILIAHEAVSEAATIGVPDDLKGQTLVCFVVFHAGRTATEAELKAHVAAQLGKPLAPKAVHVVAGLPKTRSGKIVRGSIRRAYLGEADGDASSIENPALLAAIKHLRPGH